MRLKFIRPLMPTLVEKLPEGENWIHEVKFDGYRSEMIIDDDGIRIYACNGRHWTAKYRDLVREAAKLGAESAIIDGEIIVLNDARRSLAGNGISILSLSIWYTSMAMICATWPWRSVGRY